MSRQYVVGIEQSLLFGWNDRMSEIRLFWTDLVQSVYWTVVLVSFPEFNDVIVQTWFQLRERNVLVSDIAINGTFSSRVCCRIATNAYMSRDPDENNLLSISDQIRLKFVIF